MTPTWINLGDKSHPTQYILPTMHLDNPVSSNGNNRDKQAQTRDDIDSI